MQSLSAPQIADQIQNAFSVMGNVADEAYMLPALDWVTGEFSDAWLAFRASLGTWSEDDNDCDDFARGCAFFAQLLHHNTPQHELKTALAFGEFWYDRDIGGGHAINVFLYRDATSDVGVQIGFFEPQTGEAITLSQKELESCIAWRF